LKIAIFLPDLRGGGAERVMVSLARGFSERGHDVDLVLAQRSGTFLNEVPSEVTVVDLNRGKIYKSLFALKRYLRLVKPDILLSAMDTSNVIALWAKKMARVETRVIVTVHIALSVNAKFLSRADRFVLTLARWCYRGAYAIVGVSQGVADDMSSMLSIPRKEISVIYNPVVTPELFELAQKDVDHPWFNPVLTSVILSAGRLTRQKDYPTLLQAFSLVTKVCAAKLVILGEGEDQHKLESIIESLNLQDKVSLPGFSKNPYAYMSKATLFVLSSAWEGFGNVLVESMAVGTPVVSTNCPSGPSEILVKGKYGPLTPVGDVEALANAMINLLENNSDVEALRKRANEFTYDKIADQYLAIMIEED